MKLQCNTEKLKEYQAACMENQTAFTEYHETVMNRKSSRAYKEAITQQHQEAVRGIPRTSNGIPRDCYRTQRSSFRIPIRFDGIPRNFIE